LVVSSLNTDPQELPFNLMQNLVIEDRGLKNNKSFISYSEPFIGVLESNAEKAPVTLLLPNLILEQQSCKSFLCINRYIQNLCGYAVHPTFNERPLQAIENRRPYTPQPRSISTSTFVMTTAISPQAKFKNVPSDVLKNENINWWDLFEKSKDANVAKQVTVTLRRKLYNPHNEDIKQKRVQKYSRIEFNEDMFDKPNIYSTSSIYKALSINNEALSKIRSQYRQYYIKKWAMSCYDDRNRISRNLGSIEHRVFLYSEISKMAHQMGTVERAKDVEHKNLFAQLQIWKASSLVCRKKQSRSKW